ncbi:PLP-dependent aminotransferase family protein [Sedimenticola sp.]|uniref:aminotransferase-like domain-containing protein n=1 Tax=Sedimenticola sp. TaxID=1940285 RepID=UPI003D0C48CC
MHLYQQLMSHIQDQIRVGVYRPGQILPSIRELAQQRAVSRNTVVQAYDRLAELGLIASRDRTGFYVLTPHVRVAESVKTINELMPSTPGHDHLAFSVVRSAGSSQLAPLGSAHPSGEFPALQSFRRIYNRQQRIARREEVKLTQYEVPPGHAGLRRQLVRHMARSGAIVDPEEIVVTNGCQEALSLALQTLTQPGDIVAIESPGFYGTLQCLEVLGLQILEIPSDPLYGINLDLLEQALARWPVKVILINPVFNNPQGHVMPDEAARRLLALTEQADLPIIEDDVFGDISYESGRPRSVRSWDGQGRVLLCSSLSKSLDSDLRLGWVAAGRYSEQLCYRKYVTTMACRGQIQAAAAEFLSGSRFGRHLKMISRCYRERRDFTLETINRYFPSPTRVNLPRGGFHCWVELPAVVDSSRLYTELMKQGISATPGTLFGVRGQFDHFLRINYSCINNNEKYTIIFKKIADVINAICDTV